MTYEYKAGQFSLFKNTKKEKENQPDYQGDGADLSGQLIRIAAWKKTDKNGNLWLSCKFDIPKPKEAPKEQLSDEIPY